MMMMKMLNCHVIISTKKKQEKKKRKNHVMMMISKRKSNARNQSFMEQRSIDVFKWNL